MEERVNRPLAEAIRALVVAHRDEEGDYLLPPEITPQALVALAKEALRGEFWFYQEADRLVWDIARHEGYVIPSCPVESRGDAREFLKEHGAKNADEWYRLRGFDAHTMRNFYATSAFMARNTGFWRKVIGVPKLAARSASSVAPYVVQALDFCLGDETVAGDETLFRC